MNCLWFSSDSLLSIPTKSIRRLCQIACRLTLNSYNHSPFIMIFQPCTHLHQFTSNSSFHLRCLLCYFNSGFWYSNTSMLSSPSVGSLLFLIFHTCSINMIAIFLYREELLFPRILSTLYS